MSAAMTPAQLQQALWALVERLAQPRVYDDKTIESTEPQQQNESNSDLPAVDNDSDDNAHAFLVSLRREAQLLMHAKQQLSCTDNQQETQHSTIDVRLGDNNNDISSTTKLEHQDKQSAAEANERIARTVLDGPLLAPSSTHAAGANGVVGMDEEDKSDTLSDCTTLTESSSVYGIHNTWIDLATLYALPFVLQLDASKSSKSSSSSSQRSQSQRRLAPVPALNLAFEQLHLTKIFAESQRSLHTMRAPATVDALRKVLDRGVTALHFSGHGGQIAGERHCLVFEDTQGSGLAHLVDAATLHSILGGSITSGMSDNVVDNTYHPLLQRSRTSESLENDDDATLRANGVSMLPPPPPSSSRGTLKLVVVSSCQSRAVGEVFIHAGVAHVVCVRCDDRVLDDAAAMFSHSFYHAALAGKSVHQAFESARARVSAELRLPPTEGDKFVLLESSSLHTETCPRITAAVADAAVSQQQPPFGQPIALEVDASTKRCGCTAAATQCVFADLAVGKWVDVSPTNRFVKTLPAVSESFVGREQELHALATLVVAHRFVTVRGPPGIGKSALAVKFAHFVADRNGFPDGVAFVRLRDVQTLEALESAIKSTLFPDGGREKEQALHQTLADQRALLVLDNMEDPMNAQPSAVREFLLHLLQNAPNVSLLLTARQAMGGGLAGFDEKVVSLNRLSHFHAADLFLKQAPRPLLLSEIGDMGDTSSTTRTVASVLDALTAHPLMAFLDGHPQAISLCAPLLQDRSLSELTRAVLSRGVNELQVVGLPAHDRSAVNTLVTSLGVSLEQVKMHHGPDALRFFALLGLLPAGAMPADFKSLWGPQWEALVETLLRFSLIQRTRIPGFVLANRGLPKRGGVTGVTTSGSSANSHRRSGSSRTSRASDGYDQPLLAALKSYGDYITGSSSASLTAASSGKSDAFDHDTSMSSSSSNVSTTNSSSAHRHADRHMLNTLTRSGRASRLAEHVEHLDSQAELMAVCVSYSTFPFITSYARSLLGLFDDSETTEHDALANVCRRDRDLFLYNTARHFWKVSYWVFQHICTLAARSSASYLILDMHESNLWMVLDLHVRVLDEWHREASAATAASSSANASSTAAAPPAGLSVDCSHHATATASAASTQHLHDRIGSYVVDVACFFAHALFLSGRHRGAWNAANKSLHLAKHHKDTRSEASTRKLMGILLTTETKFDEAKAQFGMALILYKAVGDKIGQAAALSAIGMIHTRKGNLRGAHNCFTKALTLYEWFQHALGQLNCHQRLANLEKKLRDGDGHVRKHGSSSGGGGGSGPNAGYSHHYAATRRLQGDLNRKRNGEYIVRWVGHEMSLLLELPVLSPEKLHEAHEPAAASLNGAGGASTSASPTVVSLGHSGSASHPHTSPRRTLAKQPSSGVTNTPKKCRLGMLIDQKELEHAQVTTGAAATTDSAVSTVAATPAVADKLKNSSFARRREYDSAIRKSAAAAVTVSTSNAAASGSDAS